MGRKEFSYPNLRSMRSLFILIIQYLFFWTKISKNYSRGIFLKMSTFINVHLSLYFWTHDIVLGKWILINCKIP